MCVVRSSTYFTGLPTSIERNPANVGTLCMKNFEPKLPPATTGTSRSLLGRDLQRGRDQPEEVGEVHRVGVDRDDARARVVVADRAVRVHRHPRRARPVELGGDGAVGVLERLVDLTEGEGALVGRVRAERLVDERRAVLARGNGVEHDRQLLVDDLDQLAARPRRCSGSRRSRPRPSRRSGGPSRSRSCPARSGRRRTMAAAPRAPRRPCRSRRGRRPAAPRPSRCRSRRSSRARAGCGGSPRGASRAA